MSTRFADQVVLITGASSGIGKAVALRVAFEGAAVVLGSRGKDQGEQVAEQIRAAGGRCSSRPMSRSTPMSNGSPRPRSPSTAASTRPSTTRAR